MIKQFRVLLKLFKILSLAFLLCVLAILITGAGFYAYSQFKSGFSCVVAPNGLLIARLKPFEPDGRTIEPSRAIKYPDGKLLMHGTGDLKFWTKKAFAGFIWHGTISPIGEFIFTDKHGLIVRNPKNEPLYQKLMAEYEPKTIAEGIKHNGNLLFYMQIFGGYQNYSGKGDSLFSKRGWDPLWANPQNWCPVDWSGDY